MIITRCPLQSIQKLSEYSTNIMLKVVYFTLQGSLCFFNAFFQVSTYGLENFKNHYSNYITGFSDAEFVIIDAFGQGDKIVKHWRFKGTHDGEFFGVPATGKQVDISGVTLVKMKDGKIASEQDFMDFLAFYTQLGLM